MLTEPKAMEVWDLLDQLYNVDKSASAKLPANVDSFAQGKAAMVVSGNFFINTLKTNAPNIKYTVAPQPTNLPKAEAQLGGWMSSVLAASPGDKKAMAWKFNRWMNTKENILYTESKFNWITTRKDAQADPKVTAYEPEKLKRFYEALPDISRVRPKSTAYEQIEQALNPIIQRLFLGEINAKQVADEANKKVDELLKADQK
jgi:multiple sugar transport system substrate-binding protein